jgi:hypothetical protein
MKKITVDSPMTLEDMIDVSIRLDEIESIIDNPQDVPDDILLGLLGELQTLTTYLEKANKIAEFRQKGFRIIQ